MKTWETMHRPEEGCRRWIFVEGGTARREGGVPCSGGEGWIKNGADLWIGSGGGDKATLLEQEFSRNTLEIISSGYRWSSSWGTGIKRPIGTSILNHDWGILFGSVGEGE